MDHSSRRSFSTSEKGGLLLVLIFSLVFALYQSNTSYTSDEVWSVKTVGLDYSGQMRALQSDIHPPLYYQVLRLWIHIFGPGERVVRSLSGLFYLLAGLAVLGLARELYGNRSAILSTVIFISSPLAIISSQFARMYALLALVSVVSSWLYQRFSNRTTFSWVTFALYVLVNILGTFTHIAFFFVLFGQAVFHIVINRRQKLILFLSAMFLSVLPYVILWAPVLLGQVVRSTEGLAWLNKPSLWMLGELTVLYAGSLLFLIPVFLYLGWRQGLDSLAKYNLITSRSFSLWMLAAVTLIPLLVSEVKPIFNSRFAIIGLPFFALTVGGILPRENAFFPGAILLLTTIGVVQLHPGSIPCNNQDVARYLNQAAQENDVIIFTSLTRLPIDYYLDQQPNRKKLYESSFPSDIDNHPGYEGQLESPSRKELLNIEAQEIVRKIQSMKSDNPHVRVFFLHGFHPAIDSILESQLRQQFKLSTTQGIQCGSVSSYFKEISLYE